MHRSKILMLKYNPKLIRFRRSRRRREIYCGHARLCACVRLSVCLSVRSRMELGGLVGDAP